MFASLFPCEETKKMPSLSSTDIKYKNIPLTTNDNILNILCLPENKDKRLILKEKNIPHNIWVYEKGTLKLQYDNLKKEIYSISVRKIEDNTEIYFLLENTFRIKMCYKTNNFYLSYIDIPNFIDIAISHWEWVDREQ
jgi:hypothetical protein